MTPLCLIEMFAFSLSTSPLHDWSSHFQSLLYTICHISSTAYSISNIYYILSHSLHGHVKFELVVCFKIQETCTYPDWKRPIPASNCTTRILLRTKSKQSCKRHVYLHVYMYIIYTIWRKWNDHKWTCKYELEVLINLEFG